MDSNERAGDLLTSDIMTIRATQKKRISCPVSSTLLGKNVFRSSVLSAGEVHGKGIEGMVAGGSEGVTFVTTYIGCSGGEGGWETRSVGD